MADHPDPSPTGVGALLASRGPIGQTVEVTKTALITGITGQDGSYLAELLLDKGYDGRSACTGAAAR